MFAGGVEFGRANGFVHIWAYQSMDQRMQVRDEARKKGVWPPPGGGNASSAQQTKIVLPSAFFAAAVASGRRRSVEPLAPSAVAELLGAAAATIHAELAALPAPALGFHPAQGEWCAKEVLGHLIEV